MKRNYSFFAKWRKKDVEFLNSLNLIKTISEGYDGFWVEEGEIYDLIINKYSKKNIFSSEDKPPEFEVTMTFVTFAEEELDNANYYLLCTSGEPKGYPLPKNGYEKQVFDFEKCDIHRINKKQKASFRIKKPKWKKNQNNFSLNWEWDRMFFKKEFYQEVLAPLGLKALEVLNHNTGKPLEDTIQLDIPVAKSKILLEGSAYDIYESRCGVKHYARQYLDFFPSFENDFSFHICYTQEEFDGGYKRIIISKEFCNILLKHNIINYHTSHLIPMKAK